MSLLNRVSLDARLEVCDRYFAPTLLSPFADDMARRLARLSIGPLLEIEAGSGVLTQAVAAAMSAGIAIVATDPSAEMVAHAARRFGVARVSWQQADPHALPFHDAAFGIVVCQFAVAAMTDRVGAFREARRVIKHGGRFVFSVFGDLCHNPVAGCVQTALTDLFPDDAPQFVAELHGYAGTTAIDDALTEAGFTDAIYTVVELPFVAASAREVGTGYCLGTRLRAELAARTLGDSEAMVVRAVCLALQQQFGNGAIESTMRAQIVSAAG